MSVNSGFPWRDNDIRRGLMLVRTSNNAHGHIDVEVLTEKVHNLSIAAKRELRDSLRGIAEGLNLEIAAATAGGMPAIEWHYVSAEEQNPNSHRLEGWFPSRALADRHRESWPAFISQSMKVYPKGMAPVSINGETLAPDDLQEGVAAELYAALNKHGLQPSRHMTGKAIKDAKAMIEKNRERRTVLVAVDHDLYETGDPDAPDAIKDANGEVVLGLCKVCNKGEVELSEPCTPKTQSAAEDEGPQLFPPVARWVIQEHCNGVWANIGAQLSNEDDAERRLEAMERADLAGKFVYRYRLVK